MSFRMLTALAAALAAAGCSGTTEASTPPLGQRLVAAAGNGQEATPGLELPQPLVVRVTSASAGVASVVVSWRVTSGAGEFLSSATIRTDDRGEARVRFLPTAHRSIVTATIEGSSAAAVQFETVPHALARFAEIPAGQRYTFFADGTFLLQFPSGQGYPGTFRNEGETLALTFSDVGPGREATATRRGDTLLISYNEIMRLADFTDAVLVLEEGDPELARGPGAGAARMVVRLAANW